MLRLLAKRNKDIGSLRTKLVCRLQAQIASLAAGGIAKELNASDADGLLGAFEPSSATEAIRHELALELLEDVRRLDAQLKESHKRIKATVRASKTSLTDVYGIGPVLACALIGYTGDISRFTSRDRFAAYNGTALLPQRPEHGFHSLLGLMDPSPVPKNRRLTPEAFEALLELRRSRLTEEEWR